MDILGKFYVNLPLLSFIKTDSTYYVMKIKLLTINLLPILLLLISILSFCKSVTAQDEVTIRNPTSEISETEKPLTDEEKKIIILLESKASEQAQRKAERFFKQYPYETSRIIYFCHRKANIRGSFFASANGNYANEFIVQEYFRTNRPLSDPTISDTLMININSQITELSQLSEDIITQKELDDSKINEINQQIQKVIDSLTEVTEQYSWSRTSLLVQIEELSKIRANNLVTKPSIEIGNKILSVANKIRRLQNLTAINGVGVRVIAELDSLDGSIDSQNLIALLSLNANGNKIRGNISTEIFGLGGRQISNAVNISTELSMDNALKAQESIYKIREALLTQSGLDFNPIDLTLSPVPIPPINLDNRLCSNYR